MPGPRGAGASGFFRIEGKEIRRRKLGDLCIPRRYKAFHPRPHQQCCPSFINHSPRRRRAANIKNLGLTAKTFAELSVAVQPT